MEQKVPGLTVTAGGLTIEQHTQINDYLRKYKAAYIVEEEGSVRILSPEDVTRIQSLAGNTVEDDRAGAQGTYLVRWSVVVSGSSTGNAAAKALTMLKNTRERYGVIEVLPTDGSTWKVYDPSGSGLD